MKRYHILLVLLNELFVLTQPETFHELPVLPFLIRHMQVQVLMLVVKVALLVLSVASSDISDSFNADKTSGVVGVPNTTTLGYTHALLSK